MHVELRFRYQFHRHDIETDQRNFEETIGDKISDGNAFGGIVEPYRFEPCASDSDKDCDNGGGGEDENAGHMFTVDWSGLFFCSTQSLQGILY